MTIQGDLLTYKNKSPYMMIKFRARWYNIYQAQNKMAAGFLQKAGEFSKFLKVPVLYKFINHL